MSNFVSVDIIDNVSFKKGVRNYPSNRQPLLGNPLQKLPLGSIKVSGWIKKQLELMRDGMTGHLQEISRYLEPDNGWLHKENHGWEEQPYWFRGFHDLGIILDDERIKADSKSWIESVISSREPDGYFGPSENKACDMGNERIIPDCWPHMVMMDALRNYHEYSNDERVIDLMLGFFKWCNSIDDNDLIPSYESLIPDGKERGNYTFGNWHPLVQINRSGDMLPHIYWLYNRTGEEWLLSLAVKFRHRMDPPDNGWLSKHVVDFTARYRVAANFYLQSGNPEDLAESENWYNHHMDIWGQQPGGIFAADELIREGKTDPRQAFETCAMVEFAKSFYILSEVTGAPVYADRCEDILFNSFPASQTPDLKALHYLTAGNQPQLDASENHDYANKTRLIDYSPYEVYRCCQHNVAMGWPYYTEHLWMAADGDGLAAWMYGDSEVTAMVGERVKVTIREETDYPFDTGISMQVCPEKPVKFPLYLRIPVWSRYFILKLNGKIILEGEASGKVAVIECVWNENDCVELSFQADISLKCWEKSAGSLTVSRGPLSYSMKIEEEWVSGGESGQWPEWEVYPRTPWNYGLVVDKDHPSDSIKVRKVIPTEGQPWCLEKAPIELSAKGRRIPDWKLGDDQTVQELPQSPVKSSEPLEEITLVPMGCARLRISCFPEIDRT